MKNYIEKHILRKSISRRGGGIEINVSDLFSNFVKPKISVYQNYLGGGLLGSVQSDHNFNEKLLKEDSFNKFIEIKEELKRYFFEITNELASDWDSYSEQSYQQNQKMPKSAY